MDPILKGMFRKASTWAYQRYIWKTIYPMSGLDFKKKSTSESLFQTLYNFSLTGLKVIF